MPIHLIVLRKHLETCKTKQIKCPIFWQETVRKLIDGLEILGSSAKNLKIKVEKSPVNFIAKSNKSKG